MPVDSWMEIYQEVSRLQMLRANGTLTDPMACVDALLNVLQLIMQKEMDK